jgi:hypothetical protein
MKNASTADAPFIFTVNYSLSIAKLIQAVSSIAMAEAILLSKSLGIPPPLPPMDLPPEQMQAHQLAGTEKVRVALYNVT